MNSLIQKAKEIGTKEINYPKDFSQVDGLTIYVYRKLIDMVDQSIVELIRERQEYVDVIQEVKSNYDKSVKDEEREKEILENVGAEDNELVKAIYEQIFLNVEKYDE